MNKKPRPHAELIRQWADGCEIQYRKPGTDRWVDSPEPAWVADYDYRIKPARKYPKLAVDDVRSIAEYFCLQDFTIELVSQRVLRHALDNGQVVTRVEFDRAIGDRKARDFAIAERFVSECRDAVYVVAPTSVADAFDRRTNCFDRAAIIAEVK